MSQTEIFVWIFERFDRRQFLKKMIIRIMHYSHYVTLFAL